MTILKELRKEIEEIEDPIAIIDAMLNEPQHYEVVKSFEELKSRLYPLTQK